jgi:DNA invertase Pin-like site-specific DNA recombinase
VDRYPVAYIRRSSADTDNPGDVSREAQEAAVREMAHRDGHNGNLRVFSDWDRSGDFAKESKRTEYAAMLTEIDAGRVSAVYAYALDRLYRSIDTFVRLRRAALTHSMRVVTLRDGVLMGDGSPMAMMFATIVAAFAEGELETAKARARGAASARIARGDHMGPARYGFRLAKVDGRVTLVPDPDRPLAPVFAAYAEAGTMAGACRILNASGLPAPRGGLWRISTVTQILTDNGAPLPARNGRGHRRNPPRAMFAQLLRCHCGRMLTPNRKRRSYYCSSGLLVKDHGRYYIAESALRPWIEAEAARLTIPGDVAEMRERDEHRRTALLAKRGRWIESYAEGLCDKATRDARLAAIVRELDRLEAADRLVEIPAAVDWSWPPEHVNAVLRALWAEVKLDTDLRPVSAEWVVPDWRARPTGHLSPLGA